MKKRKRYFKVNRLENIEINQNDKTYIPYHNMFIFSTDKKYGIWNKEGVGTLYDIDDKAKIDLKENNNKVIKMFPSGLVEIGFKELKKYIGEEIDSRDAVRVFGDRLESNYRIMLQEAEKMGVKILEDSQ